MGSSRICDHGQLEVREPYASKTGKSPNILLSYLSAGYKRSSWNVFHYEELELRSITEQIVRLTLEQLFPTLKAEEE